MPVVLHAHRSRPIRLVLQNQVLEGFLLASPSQEVPGAAMLRVEVRGGGIGVEGHSILVRDDEDGEGLAALVAREYFALARQLLANVSPWGPPWTEPQRPKAHGQDPFARPPSEDPFTRRQGQRPGDGPGVYGEDSYNNPNWGKRRW